MAKVKEGDLVLNHASSTMLQGEVAFVVGVRKQSSSFKGDVIKIQTLSGKLLEVNQDNVLEASFFLHPEHGVCYMPSVTWKALMNRGLPNNDKTPIYVMFKKVDGRVKVSVERKEVKLKDLVYVGEIGDLDGRDEYAKK